MLDTTKLRAKWMAWYHEPTREDRSDQTIADFFISYFESHQKDLERKISELPKREVLVGGAFMRSCVELADVINILKQDNK